MKKSTIIIIILSTLLILAIVLLFFLFSQNRIIDGDGMVNNNLINSNQTEEGKFGDYTIEEWKEMIAKYYRNNYGYTPAKIDCYYDEYDQFVSQVYDKYNNQEKYYVFNTYDYLAMTSAGTIIDFIKGEKIEQDNFYNIEFKESEDFAIGYLLDEDIKVFAEKYFYSIHTYDSLETYDFRTDENKKKNLGNRFVIVPKNDNVFIRIYNCYINEEEEIDTHHLIMETTNRPIVVYTDYMEVVPNIAINFSHDENKLGETFYVMFRGDNGKLNMSNFENKIKDISIYNVVE